MGYVKTDKETGEPLDKEDEDETHPTLYDKPYFIGPESDSVIERYRLFTKTLEETGRMAVRKVVLRVMGSNTKI